MHRLNVFIVLLCFMYPALRAQEMIRKEKPPYDRKEEIIFDGKRYRIHNSYLTLGGGFMQSTIRSSLQKGLGLDFQFPIRRHHFQMGAMMSGESFSSNNHIQGHVCYGLRRERTKNNLAIYLGPSYATGVEGSAATGLPRFYQGFGAYLSAQAITKFAYDIGLGVEVFGDISPKQTIAGIKLIAFFSGAYRGPKRNFNPNVRSENPK